MWNTCVFFIRAIHVLSCLSCRCLKSTFSTVAAECPLQMKFSTWSFISKSSAQPIIAQRRVVRRRPRNWRTQLDLLVLLQSKLAAIYTCIECGCMCTIYALVQYISAQIFWWLFIVGILEQTETIQICLIWKTQSTCLCEPVLYGIYRQNKNILNPPARTGRATCLGNKRRQVQNFFPILERSFFNRTPTRPWHLNPFRGPWFSTNPKYACKKICNNNIQEYDIWD
jgi:hypothetical protein